MFLKKRKFVDQNSLLHCVLQVVFLGEEGVDAGGVRKVKLFLSFLLCGSQLNFSKVIT